MSRFKQLSHAIWHCQSPIVWVPKYRFRILTGRVAEEVASCIRTLSEQQKAEVIELNVQIDPVHLLVMGPPKVAISDFVGTVKGAQRFESSTNSVNSSKNPIGATTSGRVVTALTPWA